MQLAKVAFVGVFSLLACHDAYSAVPAQNWTYTYTAQGKLESADGPRTDVTDITEYSYDNFNRLASITNALGHVDSILEYDANGLPLRVRDANGLETHYTYTARGWLETVTVKATSGDLVTTFAYSPTGMVTDIVYPDSASMTFEYDDAQRLTAIQNTLGERMEYVLDPAGNVLEEKVFAAGGGTLARAVSHSYDELSRLIDVNGNNGQNTSITYNKNGERVATTDGNLHTTRKARDALGQVIAITDANNKAVLFTYDSTGRIRSITDQRNNTTSYEYDFAGHLTKLTSPDTGTTFYDYDPAGNRVQQVDARGTVTQYSYDALNRLTAINYPGDASQNAIFRYDSTINGNKGVGHLTRHSNGAGSTDLFYNDLGHLIQQDDTIGSWEFSTQYHYDSMGRITSIIYPSGRIISYDRDALGRIIAITTKDDTGAPEQTIVSDVQYQPYGSVASLDYGNGIAQVYTYNLDGQLESVIATGLGNIRSEYYTYDLAGNITGIANDLNTSGDRTFSYDPLNRLVSETYIGGERNYQYDAVGNRTQLIWARSGQSQETNTYTFEALSNRLIQKDTQLWTTDQLGNTLSAEGNAQTYTYDHANRLQSYSENGQLKATYHYNAQGQRVRTDKTEDTLLHYDQSGKYLGETNLNAANTEVISQIDYIYLDDFPVAQITTPYDQQGLPQKTRLTYLHTDHLNTPRIGTNTNQEIVWRWDSDAFGQQAPDTDPDTDNDITEVNLRFPGQIKGSESPHFYNYYRDYAPSLGRYLQSDPIGLAGGVNTFGYGYQNPIRNYDPDGRFVWILGLGALGGTGTTTAAGTGFLATGAILGGAAVVASIPGDTPIDRGSKARERKEYSRVCKTPIPPTGNPCTDARNNLSRLQKCLQLRENFSRKWYNDGDPGHITEIQNTRNAIKNLENWIRDHCGGQCE